MANSLSNRRYWLNWTIVCGAGEFLGIAAAAGIWLLHSTVFGEPQVITQRILLVVVMMLAGVVEGLITGAFQWSVLKYRFVNMKARNWLLFTALGAAIAWLMGMIPSTSFATDSLETSLSGFEISGIQFILLAALMGAVLGIIFGFFQWLELKKHAQAAGKWVAANSLGWLAGMVVIFSGASMPSDDTGLLIIILIGAISGLLAGLLVGAITGLFLIGLRYK